MKRLIALLIGVALFVASCGGLGGTAFGGVTSFHVKDAPVTCFALTDAGAAKSIDCLPDWFINYKP